MRLALASIFTLLTLSAFLLTVIVALMLYTGVVSFTAAILFVVVTNIVVWLVSPTISDYTYRYLYDMRWVSMSEFRQHSPKSVDVIEDVTREYGYSEPKLGIIHDGNPNAFTYGSGRWNARIVMTEGCFEYLDDNEVSSVMAHELGHVTNRDFIIMTIANTLVQLLYLVSVYARRIAENANSGSNDKNNAGGAFALVALLAYVFYVIGEYLVLYLSRVREYKADNFAADQTNPDYLSSALIKIAYGIAVTDDSPELARATRNIGIMDVQECEDDGHLYYQCERLHDFEPLAKSFLFDLKNPWAWVKELTSTHPLTGKRIKNLSGGDGGTFDFDEIVRKYPVDTRRMWREFLTDILFAELPMIGAIVYPIGYAAAVVFVPAVTLDTVGLFVGSWLALIGVAVIVQTRYRYPRGEPEETTVLELMGDPYASPIRGKNVTLDGTIVGRGQAGYKFGSDLMLKDDTGFMYLNYQHPFGVIGNMLFGAIRVPKLLDTSVTVDGWFLRSTAPWTTFKTLHSSDRGRINGYAHYRGYIIGALCLLVGGLFFVLSTATL